MNIKKTSEKKYIPLYFIETIKTFFNKELCLGLYFLWFILGMTAGFGLQYDEFRVFQVTLLLIVSWFYHQYFVTKVELLFFAFIALGSFFWAQPVVIIVDMLLFYLLYKSFYLLSYQHLLTKLIVLSSLVLFLLLPLSLWDYISTGVYYPNWYPQLWSIRTYDSYFFIIAIFAVWFYLTETRYRFLYLLFLFLAFLAVLLDGGRSVTLAYTVFIVIVSMFHRKARWPLISIYFASWLIYIVVNYAAILNNTNLKAVSLRVARESSSGRYDLWENAFQCWWHHPIIGCGFYQLDKYPNLSAHPHNLFIQILTETGLIGFSFLAFIIFQIVKQINWDLKQNYFVIAALLAVSIDMSLSGIYVYPITQMALLWLFVFLLKNPEFSHAQYFSQPSKCRAIINNYISIIIYLILAVIFFYIFVSTNVLIDAEASKPPRFWMNGYKIF